MGIGRMRADAREIVQLARRHDYVTAVGIVEIMLRRIRADGYCDGAQSRIEQAARALRTAPLPPIESEEVA